LWNSYTTKILDYKGYVVINFLIESRMYDGIDRNLKPYYLYVAAMRIYLIRKLVNPDTRISNTQ